MRRVWIHLKRISLVLSAATAPSYGQVVGSEFFSDPVAEGWDLYAQHCAQTWLDNGWYYQQFNPETCSTGTNGAGDVYTRWITEFNGQAQFFLEFRVHTDGDRSEIPYGAPIVVGTGNFYGIIYHVTVARDLVKFARDIDLPIWFIGIKPGVPHTFRIELDPEQYAFYIDGYLIDEGVSEGPFPAHDSRISWQGYSQYLPCDNAWDYIRYGVIPVDGGGDYDSNRVVKLDDFYFFHECLTNQRPGIIGGPGQDAGPGCRFADFDSDADVDLRDLAAFQNAFTSSP